MKEPGRSVEHGRRDWTIVLIIILLGFLFVILAGEWAVRFAPTWKLDTNMQSNLDPDSDFLTNRPAGFFEPLDPSILTQPAWINVFQTPGAIFETRPPAPITTNTPLPTNTFVPTFTESPPTVIPSTGTLAVFFPFPTSTFRFIPPPPTQTPTPGPSRTNTPLPTAVSADLQITKTDGVTTYIDSGSITYTILVSNPAGPNGVNGAVVTDTFPPQIASANWTCVPSGGAACTSSGSGNINDTVSLPTGGFVAYTVNATIGSGVSGNLVNTASVSLPGGYSDPVPANNSATDTDIFSPSADLRVTKTDNATDYTAGSTVNYSIVVSNPVGPNNINGAVVTDTFSSNTNIASAGWTCSSSGGATCTAGGSGNISDTVNLPVGSSITYNVTAVITASPSGNLVNIATITLPAGTVDTAPGNNSATDTDNLITANPLPGQIGTTPDNNYYQLPAGGMLTLSLTTVVNGDPDTYELVIYEFNNMGIVYMDWMIIQIGDGRNWYTVFYWGDNSADTNSNINFNLMPALVPPEQDDRPLVTATYFYNGPGILIDLDPVAPLGTYPWLRIIAPSGDVDGHMEIDAIEILP